MAKRIRKPYTVPVAGKNEKAVRAIWESGYWHISEIIESPDPVDQIGATAQGLKAYRVTLTPIEPAIVGKV